MSITATCANCGKTYQAPERMAGKSVRCKACGEIFRIDPPPGLDAGDPTGTNIDLDALERSFGDADATHGGSRAATGVGGPSVDAHGRSSIRRESGTQGLDLDGEGGGVTLRSNFRYRYPGARQIDKLLPWALVALTLFVVLQGSFRTEEAVVGEAHTQLPPTGVAVARTCILVALYVVIVWPISHIAITMASRKMRFSMPRAAAWRTFAGFTPVLMLGAGLFIFGGGEVSALVMGLIVGIALAVGAIAVLFRIFPNEIPTVGAYAAGGAMAGAGFAIAILIAGNLVAMSVAKSDPKIGLRVSPIAIGMPWPERPIEPVVVIAPRTNSATTGQSTSAPPADPIATIPQEVVDAGPQLLPLPNVPSGQVQLLGSLELAPVRGGFDAVIVPPTASDAIGVVRYADGGRIETWDRNTWRRPIAGIGRDFDAMRSPLILSPAGTRVIRLVTDPVDRIEELALGNTAVLPPKRVSPPNGGQRALFALLGESEALCTVRYGNSIALEQFSVAEDRAPLPAETLKVSSRDIAISGSVAQTLRLLPNASGLVVACRETMIDGSTGDARLLRYDLTDLSKPIVAGEIYLNRAVNVAPVSLALNASGDRAALVLNSGGELNLTIWDLKPSAAVTAGQLTLKSPSLDRKIGLLQTMRPASWDDGYDPIVWVDDQTILVYGRELRDVRTGRSLGETNLTGLVGVLPRVDPKGRVTLIQTRSDGRTLVSVKFDAAALAKARE